MARKKTGPKAKNSPRSGIKTKGAPAAGAPKASKAPESLDRHKISWQFHRIDTRHERWGWHIHGAEHFWSLFTEGQLSNIETMTWAELRQANGGRSHGTNHHSIPVENLCKEAQEQLQELQLDDQDEIFSLRLNGKGRVVGFRSGSALQILWYDENHEVCISNKKKT